MTNLPSQAHRARPRIDALVGWAQQIERRTAALASLAKRPALIVSAFVAVAGLWLMTHMYEGVHLDARIYMGRALADLAPSTIGQDLMFSHDGQAGFSAFTLLARALVAKLGVPEASFALALAGMITWFAAITALAVRLAGGRAPWIMLAGLAILPNTYGGFNVIPVGEVLALPRPFSEAGVLAAFAAYLNGRNWLPLGFLLAAGLFHPIMALCGLGVFFVLLAWEDRRWVAIAAGFGVLVVLAGVLELPLANRLFKTVDPAWLDLLKGRNPYLFPGLWTTGTWSQAAIQITTTIIAATLLPGRAQRLFISAAVVAMAGVGLTWLLGDVFHNLLVLQVQPWRTLWITAVLGALSAPFCAAKLWRAGPASQVVLAALASGWLFSDSSVALWTSALALTVYVWDRRFGGARISPLSVYAAWSVVAFLMVFQLGQSLKIALDILPNLPPGASAETVLRALHLETIIVGPVVIWAAVTGGDYFVKTRALLLPALAAVLLAVGLWGWHRAPATTDFGVKGDPHLASILGVQPGPVEWIDGDTQPWMIAGRANWATELQGASIVFSREQGLVWRDRMQRLMALRLVSPHVLEPFNKAVPISSVSGTALTALCATPDGPAWIISHVLDSQAPPQAPNTQIWRPQKPTSLYLGNFHWSAVSAFAVTRCDRASSPRRA